MDKVKEENYRDTGTHLMDRRDSDEEVDVYGGGSNVETRLKS